MTKILLLTALCFSAQAFAQAEIRTKSELNSILGGWHFQIGAGAGFSAYSQNLAQEHRNLSKADGARLPLAFTFGAYHQLKKSKFYLGPEMNLVSDTRFDSSLAGNNEQKITSGMLAASLLYAKEGNTNHGLIVKAVVGLANVQSETVHRTSEEEHRNVRANQGGFGAGAGLGYMTSPWEDEGPSLLYLLTTSVIHSEGQAIGPGTAVSTMATVSAFF
jgi:hypothetical protein